MTTKDLFKGTTYNSLEEQVGGKHYRNMKIQPAEFINENKLLFAEGNAIKYICRHQSKGKEEDIKKAIHYLEQLLKSIKRILMKIDCSTLVQHGPRNIYTS